MLTFAHTFSLHLDMTFSHLFNLPSVCVKPGLLAFNGMVGTLGLSLWRLNSPFARKREKHEPNQPVNYEELAVRCSQLEEQLNRVETEKSTLTEKLDLRSRELTTQTLNLLQKNALMEEVREMIAEIIKSSTPSSQPQKVSYNRLI